MALRDKRFPRGAARGVRPGVRRAHSRAACASACSAVGLVFRLAPRRLATSALVGPDRAPRAADGSWRKAGKPGTVRASAARADEVVSGRRPLRAGAVRVAAAACVWRPASLPAATDVRHPAAAADLAVGAVPALERAAAAVGDAAAVLPLCRAGGVSARPASSIAGVVVVVARADGVRAPPDPHVASLAPSGAPGVAHDPVALAVSVVPADEDDAVVDAGAARAAEDAAPVVAEAGIRADGRPYGPVYKDGVLDVGDRRAAQRRVADQLLLVLVRRIAPQLTGIVREVRLVDGSGAQLAGRDGVDEQVEGHPAAIATPAIPVARDEVLLRNVAGLAVLLPDDLLDHADSGECPARTALALVLDRRAADALAEVVSGWELAGRGLRGRPLLHLRGRGEERRGRRPGVCPLDVDADRVCLHRRGVLLPGAAVDQAEPGGPSPHRREPADVGRLATYELIRLLVGLLERSQHGAI